MNREYANQLLQQADANRIWAGISKPRQRRKLVKTAQAMELEAIRILDSIGEGYTPDEETKALTHEELLASLGL